MAHDVFISYSAPDRSTADAICAALEGQGINCWIAPRNILASTEYSEAIVDAIAASSLLVLVFSTNSNKSRDVASELDLAFQNEKDIPILAFRIENVKPSKGTAYYLSATHWLDAFTPPLETHLEHLVGDVKSLLEGKPLPPSAQTPQTPPPPARDWKPILIAAGAVLFISIFMLWFFTPSADISVTGPATPTPTPTLTTTPTTATTPTPTSPTQPTTINYEQQYEKAVGLLNDANLPNRLEGIRLLGMVCESGNEVWYWRAMNLLTNFVQANARWKDEATQLSNEMRPVIFGILEVIAARRPPYPANADDKYMRTHRRNLRSTDLRGLRLVASRAHLEYVDFQGAHLDGAALPGAWLEGAMLREASLKNVNLYEADLKGVDLVRADINKADLSKVTGLNWYDIGGAYNWQCANLEAVLASEVKTKVKTASKDCE